MGGKESSEEQVAVSCLDTQWPVNPFQETAVLESKAVVSQAGWRTPLTLALRKTEAGDS